MEVQFARNAVELCWQTWPQVRSLRDNKPFHTTLTLLCWFPSHALLLHQKGDEFEKYVGSVISRAHTPIKNSVTESAIIGCCGDYGQVIQNIQLLCRWQDNDHGRWADVALNDLSQKTCDQFVQIHFLLKLCSLFIITELVLTFY